MNQSDLIRELKFQNKILRDQVEAFRSGQKFTQLRDQYKALCTELKRQIAKKERKNAELRARMSKSRKTWMEVNEDVIEEKNAAVAKMQTEIDRAHAAEQRAKEEVAKLREKLSKMESDLIKTRMELDAARTRIKELEVKTSTDFTNSSKPSSSDPNHKTIVNNSREKTDRKPGGQPGHEHHPRKWAKKVSATVQIPTEERYLDTSLYKPTGRTVKKQVISVAFNVFVTEYVAMEYVNLKTGQRVHSTFPDNLTDDVTYDGSVKALAYLLNHGLYASVDKTRKFLSDISDGDLNLSKGLISNLSQQFSKITAEQRRDIFKNLHDADVMHADFTFGRVNGKQGTVLVMVNAEDGTVMYQQKPAKGKKGIENSPLVGYEGTTVTDHESILVKQGSKEQECLAHVSRYAKGGQEHEPSKMCFSDLRKWVSESVGYRNDVIAGKREKDDEYTRELKDRMDRIVRDGMKEYEKDPAPAYYRNGYNLIKRMSEHPEDYRLFLNDFAVPPTNNRAESAGRKIKRKFHQVMAFRSDDGLKYFCDGQTIIQTLKKQEGNVYRKLSEIFEEGRGATVKPIYVYVETDDETDNGGRQSKNKKAVPHVSKKTICIEI